MENEFEIDGITYQTIEGKNEVAVSCALGSGKSSVTIPAEVTYEDRTYRVTSIGYMAFSRCSDLTSINIPDSVTKVEESAFEDCVSLKDTTIYNQHVFVQLKRNFVGTYSIPNGITKICDYAFKDCKGLTSVVIPNSVQYVGKGVFEGCLCTIITYSTVNCHCPYECTLVDEVSGIMHLVKGYDKNAPINFKHIRAIRIYEDADDFEYECDYHYLENACTYYPLEVAVEICSNIVSDEFTSVEDLDYDFSKYPFIAHRVVVSNGIVRIYRLKDAYEWHFIDSDTIERGEYLWTPKKCDYFKMALRPITHVTSDSFDGQFESDFIIPEGVKSIHKSDFRELPDWTTIKLPRTLEEFEGIDANGCKETFIEFKTPSSLRVIPDDAFCGCKYLNPQDTFIIPDGVVKIGDSAFEGCSSLTSIIIPNTVTSIGDSAFKGCSSLTSITIPNSVTCIGDSAFEGCSSLTSITIPNSVTCIGDSAFEGCSSLTSIIIPNTVTSIGDSAFIGCSSLTSIFIPNTVTSIGDSAFEGCECTINAPKALALAKVGIPKACTLIEY